VLFAYLAPDYKEVVAIKSDEVDGDKVKVEADTHIGEEKNEIKPVQNELKLVTQ